MTEVAQVKFMEYMSSSEIPIDRSNLTIIFIDIDKLPSIEVVPIYIYIIY